MTTEAFAQVPLAQIVASLTNPRKTFNPERLAELAESVRASGVHTPVMLRPLPGARVADTAHLDPRPQYELVSGERRYRASEMAGAPTIPAMIRPLTDEQVLDIQLVENLQRDDLLPLEEAEGYERLMHAHEPALTAEQIGARIGKSRSYVYARLKLLNLGPDGREALRLGQIEPSVALLIARIPCTQLQAAALGNVNNAMTGEALSARAASALIQRQYMLRLSEAKFKITDGSLTSAGSCRECPKRTGADPDLFADVKGADVCTDPPCFKGKEQAHQAQQHKAARESGATIIEGREAKALVPHSWDTRVEGYLRLDDKDDAPGREKTLRQLIGKQMEKAGITPTMVANPHQDGELIAVITHAQASELLAAKGHQDKAQQIDAKASESAKAQAAAEQGKAQEAFENAWRWRVLEQAWARISTREEGMYSVGENTVRAIARQKIPNNAEKCKRLCKLLGLGTVAPSAALYDWVQEIGDPDRALALFVMFEDIEWRTWGPPDNQVNQRLLDVATDTGIEIDVAAVKAEVQAEHTAGLKAKKKAQAAKAAETAEASPPLPSAAQADGVRGKGKPKKGPAAPGPKKPKTSAGEAMQGIAAAMQGMGEGEGADAGPSGADPDGASAVGEGGRATAPDAGAARGIAPGARVTVCGYELERAGTVVEDLAVCTDEAPQWSVLLDRAKSTTVYGSDELTVLHAVAGARVEFIGAHFPGQLGRIKGVCSFGAGKKIKNWSVYIDGFTSEFVFEPHEFRLVVDETRAAA